MIKILMPLDFSPCSLNALVFAIQMTKVLEGKLVLLHVVEPMGGDATMFIDEHMIKDELSQGRQKMSDVMDEVEDIDLIKKESLILTGFPVEQILETVKEKNISLIVMGTEGTNNKFQDLLGSNTYNVIRKTNCAVMSIPSGANNFNFKKIGLAADLHKKENVHMLTLIKHIAKYFNSDINFLHVSKAEHISLEEDARSEAVLWLSEHFKGFNHSFVNLSSKDDIAQTLDQYTTQNDIDLIAISPGKHGLFDLLIKGSTTRKLVLHAHLPVLTLPADF